VKVGQVAGVVLAHESGSFLDDGDDRPGTEFQLALGFALKQTAH